MRGEERAQKGDLTSRVTSWAGPEPGMVLLCEPRARALPQRPQLGALAGLWCEGALPPTPCWHHNQRAWEHRHGPRTSHGTPASTPTTLPPKAQHHRSVLVEWAGHRSVQRSTVCGHRVSPRTGWGLEPEVTLQLLHGAGTVRLSKAISTALAFLCLSSSYRRFTAEGTTERLKQRSQSHSA